MNEQLTKAYDSAQLVLGDVKEAYGLAVDKGDTFACEYLLLVIQRAEELRNMLIRVEGAWSSDTGADDNPRC